MLYLMMDKTDKEHLVKVGFSDGGTAKRRKQYYSYNPRAIMRSSCAGSRSMENSCHDTLAKAGAIRIKGTEWFVVSAELFNTLYTKGMAFFRPKHQPIHFLEEFENNV